MGIWFVISSICGMRPNGQDMVGEHDKNYVGELRLARAKLGRDGKKVSEGRGVCVVLLLFKIKNYN